ncbi:MAG TPA: DUF3562 domain-containing protein [Usitatibacter sp.]
MAPNDMPLDARARGVGVQSAIADIARQTERPIEEVKNVYLQQLDLLHSYATVKAFVPILAKRRTREVLTRH